MLVVNRGHQNCENYDYKKDTDCQCIVVFVCFFYEWFVYVCMNDLVLLMKLLTCWSRFSADETSVKLEHRPIFCPRWGEQEVGEVLLKYFLKLYRKFSSIYLYK